MQSKTFKKFIYLDQGDTIGSVDLVQYMGSDLTVVNAARASYDKFKVEEGAELSEEDKKLIKYLINHKHTSTLEHNIATFRFKVPLFVAKQHMRHRTWSFNEISRRHTSENIEFWTPNSYRVPDPKNSQQSLAKENFDPTVFITHGEYNVYECSASSLQRLHAKDCLERYNALIKAGVAREQARAVLPEGLTVSRLYMNGTIRSWIHYIELRSANGTQKEHMDIAKACAVEIAKVFPMIKNHIQQ